MATVALSGLASLTSGALANLESALAGNYTLKKTLTGLLTAAVANESNPAALQKLAMEIETTAGTPQAVVTLAPSLATQTNAVGFMQVVQAIETEVNKL